jgi:hypothetical protein
MLMAVGIPVGLASGILAFAADEFVSLTPLLPMTHHSSPTGAITSFGISGAGPSVSDSGSESPAGLLPGPLPEEASPVSPSPAVPSPAVSPPEVSSLPGALIPTETRLKDMSSNRRATSNARAIAASLTGPFNTISPTIVQIFSSLYGKGQYNFNR